MSWSLLVTAPHRERAVASMLATFRIDHHLFQELRQQVWRGRIVIRPAPIFPGYIFVALTGLVERVREIGGVLGWVAFGERISVVPNGTVQQLVDASTNDILPLRVAPIVSRFHGGDRVRVCVQSARGHVFA